MVALLPPRFVRRWEVGLVDSCATLATVKPLGQLVFALAFASGCGEPLPIQIGSLRHDPGDEALVDEAVAMLGLEWEHSTKLRGTIVLALVDPAGNETNAGLALIQNKRCYKAAISLREPRFVAHEIGHLLGLDHVCEAPCPDELSDNLMNGEMALGNELTEDQFDDLDKGRRILTHCR